MKFVIIIFLNLFFISVSLANLFKVKKDHNPKSIQKKLNKAKKVLTQSVSLKNSALAKNEIQVINAEADKKNAQAVQSFLKSRNMGITDNTSSFDVLTGTTLKGVVLNSIVSSNLESPILVQVMESSCDIPINTKLICSGATRGKRVSANCSKLVTSTEEFEINASLLNIDGTAGLTGVVFTGKEELVLGSLTGGALSAALDVSRDRVSTATGELATNSQRNKVITGAMGGLDEAVSIMGDEAKNKETKITIEAGKEVLIFINQRFKI